MKFEATFSEHGRVMTRTYDKPDATKEEAQREKRDIIATLKIEWEE